MGYSAGESVIDYSYCEADVFKSAKSNIRHFIEVIIGIVIGIALLSALGSLVIGSLSCLGGCFGCEACLETAACADDCLEDSCFGGSGCWVEKTQENIDKANERVSCDGIDCLGREGCFACGGCGDCEHCSGVKYIKFTIVVGDQTYSHKITDKTKRVEVYYPDNLNSTYYEFRGYYNKEEGGNRYVDESGYIVKSLKNGMKLYGRYEECNKGETYTFNLKLDAFGMQDTKLAFTIGGPFTGLPAAPEREGYDFAGWYLNGKYVHSGKIESGATFHLSTFKLSPNDASRTYTLEPRYKAKIYTVKFVDGSRTAEYEASYLDTFGILFNMYNNEYGVMEEQDSFFGWGLSDDAEPEQRIKSDMKVEGDVTLYSIRREAVFYKFYYNTSNNDDNYIKVKFREGQTEVYFSDQEDLKPLEAEDANPGYNFLGWYTSRSGGFDDQRVNFISYVDEVSRSYYAHWEKATYTIEYFAKNYETGNTNPVGSDSYEMSNTDKPLLEAVKVPYNIGYEFGGWCETENFSDTAVDVLPSGSYGNKKYYAKFIPDTYTVTLITDDGEIPKYGDGANIGREQLSYGSSYTLPKAEWKGHEFLGWYYDDGSEQGGAKLTDGEGKSLAPLTLTALGLEMNERVEESLACKFKVFAKWKLETHTVTFIVDGDVYERLNVSYGEKAVPKNPTPTKKGHDFSHWTYEMYGNKEVFDLKETPIRQDWTLTAEFEVQMYKVKFVMKNDFGSWEITLDIKYGRELQAIEQLLDEDDITEGRNRRAGWYTTENCAAGTEFGANRIFEESITLYAKYVYSKQYTFIGQKKDQYTEWYFWGDKILTLANDDSKGTEKETARDGYTFLGWYADKQDWREPVIGPVTITASTPTTFYAKHQAIEYTIYYRLPNGSTTSAYEEVKYTIEDTVYLRQMVTDPSKEGYTFNGWMYNGVVKETFENTYKDKEVVAKFTPNEYDVTLLDADGYSYDTKKVTYDAGFTFGIPEIPTGKHFVGWKLEGKLMTDDKGVSLSGMKYTFAYDLNAVPEFAWNVYDVIWKDAETDAEMRRTSVTHGKSVTSVDVKKDGYTFKGWYADKECTEEFDFYASSEGEEIIYGKYEINYYTVKFRIEGLFNGKNVNEEFYVTPEQIAYNTALESVMKAAESQEFFTKHVSDYALKFEGWEGSDSKTYKYTDTMPDNPTFTLKARFNGPTTVIFQDHNGNTLSTKVYYRGESISDYSYQRKGYTWVGWYKTIATELQKFNDFKADGSCVTYTYKPSWKPNEYTIRYFIGGVLQKTVTYSMAETEDKENGGYTLWVPTAKKGKDFDGWYLNNQGAKITKIDNTNATESNKIYGNMDFYGEYVAATYTVTFKVKGESSILEEYTIKIHHGDALTPLTWISALETKYGRQVRWFINSQAEQIIGANGNWIESTYIWEEDLELLIIWKPL